MPKITFPQDFIWGCAASAYQVEGAWNEEGKGPSIWDTFVHTPGKIANGENGDVAVDHYHRYKEDVALMKELGLDAYRFSVAWSRVLPNGTGRVNEAGLDFYDRLVDELLANKIEPYLCLFHYDLPQVLQDKGGWPNRDTAYAFADYARIVTERLSDRVKVWMTHNEPNVTSFVGHILGVHAPGKKNPLAGARAMHHVFLSHGLAAEAIRASARQPVKIGITLSLTPTYPARQSMQDIEAARKADIMMNRVQLDPFLKGRYPLDESALLRWLTKGVIKAGDTERMCCLDLLGINYYSRAVLKYNFWIPILQAQPVKPAGSEYTSMWEIYPQGMYDLLMRVWKDYRPTAEIMVTENGIPVPDELDLNSRCQDDRRICYLQDHIAQVRRAMDDGVPIKGYFHWSLMDNFEGALGYGPRFGLVYVDYKTLQRTIKDSGRWFSKVIQENGFEI